MRCLSRMRESGRAGVYVTGWVSTDSYTQETQQLPCIAAIASTLVHASNAQQRSQQVLSSQLAQFTHTLTPSNPGANKTMIDKRAAAGVIASWLGLLMACCCCQGFIIPPSQPTLARRAAVVMMEAQEAGGRPRRDVLLQTTGAGLMVSAILLGSLPQPAIAAAAELSSAAGYYSQVSGCTFNVCLIERFSAQHTPTLHVCCQPQKRCWQATRSCWRWTGRNGRLPRRRAVTRCGGASATWAPSLLCSKSARRSRQVKAIL